MTQQLERSQEASPWVHVFAGLPYAPLHPDPEETAGQGANRAVRALAGLSAALAVALAVVVVVGITSRPRSPSPRLAATQASLAKMTANWAKAEKNFRATNADYTAVVARVASLQEELAVVQSELNASQETPASLPPGEQRGADCQQASILDARIAAAVTDFESHEVSFLADASSSNPGDAASSASTMEADATQIASTAPLLHNALLFCAAPSG